MSVSEQDLELLESLLDGELNEEQSAALRQRLGTEPQLAATLQQLRAQRDDRQAVFRACEPTEAEVATLCASVRAAIRRERLWGRRLRTLRYASAMAACLAFGFLAGRFIAFNPATPDTNGVVFELSPGPMQEVQYAPSPGPFRVILTDAYGRVIAEQPFSTFDEAREFTEDLSRLQRPQPVRPVQLSETIYTKGQF